jgi:hypothetical protein
MENTPYQEYFFPMTVSTMAGKRDSIEEVLARWSRFDLLKEEDKHVLLSSNVQVAIRKIAIKFSLPPSSIEEISRIIREIYFNNISKNNLSHELMKKNPTLTVSDAQEISKILEEDIFLLKLHSKEELEMEKVKLSCVQIRLSEALLKYPKLAEQGITTDQIKLRYSPEPVRPSIKNWITDFHDALGAGKHGPVERGNFLFHSENGKNLSAIDRQRLGIILKSLDEQTLLTIDGEKQVVVFENAARTPFVGAVQAPQQQRNSINIPENNRSSNASTVNVSPFENKKVPFQQENNTVAKNTIQNSTFHEPAAVAKPPIEKAPDFFEIPGSKPPIGSSEFNPDSKKNEVMEIPKQESILLATEPLVKEEMINTQANRDLMSDDMLFEMLQQKKITSANTTEKNNLGTDGDVVFSSAQKLPAEQMKNNEKINVPNEVVQMKEQPTASQNYPQSSFRITPSLRASQENTGPKVQKNVVDLRN